MVSISVQLVEHEIVIIIQTTQVKEKKIKRKNKRMFYFLTAENQCNTIGAESTM